jgi:GT2 family glycosyltransferase
MVRTFFPEVTLIDSGGNIGFGRANNLGVAQADTPFILFLNPDTQVLGNSIDTMVDFLKANPSVGAVGCKMKSPPGVDIPDAKAHTLGLQWFPSPFTELLNMLLLSGKTIETFKRYLPYQDPNESAYVSKLYGGCLMVRKETLEQAGCFDERFFMYAEDVDLCRRITEHGWKLYYLSEAEIIHQVARASVKTSENFSTLMKCESISKLMHKYYGKKGEVMYRLVVLAGSHVRLVILVILVVVSHFSSAGRKKDIKESLRKYKAMIRWSLNLQKPVITT